MKLRFSIRDVLWLTLVVALAVGWWLDHRRWRKYIVGIDRNGVVTVIDTETNRIYVQQSEVKGVK